jgi:hypothetical protein
MDRITWVNDLHKYTAYLEINDLLSQNTNEGKTAAIKKSI